MLAAASNVRKDVAMTRLTLPEARRIALATQGFGRPRPKSVGTRQLRTLVRQLGQFQIDSVNVMARAHYLPAFSRLGAYDTSLLDGLAGAAPRALFEYWGHAASFMDVDLQPSLRFKMADSHLWGGVESINQDRPQFVDEVLSRVAARPRGVTARDLDGGEVRTRDSWGWNWSGTKTALEWLFHAGKITVVRRNSSFERVYAVPEKVLPASVLSAPTPSVDQAHQVLAARALAALGVADVRTVADYFRVGQGATRTALAALVAEGHAEQVEVGESSGWYLWRDAAKPRRITANALLSPFDNLLFERRRLEDLFGFRYRIEIYVPQAQRQYGYYVYPFLMDEAFAARVDLKADRPTGRLLVQAAWLEPTHEARASEVAERLARAVNELAAWQGLKDIQVMPRGDLSGRLSGAVDS